MQVKQLVRRSTVVPIPTYLFVMFRWNTLFVKKNRKKKKKERQISSGGTCKVNLGGNVFWCERYSFVFLPTAVAVHCWRATSAYTWSDVYGVLLILYAQLLRLESPNPSKKEKWPSIWSSPPATDFVFHQKVGKKQKGSVRLSGFAFSLEAEGHSRATLNMCQRDKRCPQALCLAVLVLLFYSSSITLRIGWGQFQRCLHVLLLFFFFLCFF